jgi:GNAT superfamily N-acetyltransferase
MDLQRTDSTNADFRALVDDLDAELAIRDGDEHAFYSQFNKIDALKHCIVAYENGIAVGCGALKHLSVDTAEVKRMFTTEPARGKGIASRVLQALEAWAAELSYAKVILETGKKQPEAIALYEKSGYHRIPNYGQYLDKDNSVCFEKGIGQT